MILALIAIVALPLFNAASASPLNRMSLVPRSSGCLAGYNADVNGTCHRVSGYNCSPDNCASPIPANSRPICSPEGQCGFECNAGRGYSNGSCNKAQKPCDPATCDAHTPKNAKATCFDDKCYFQCFTGYHRVADFCKRTIYACTTNPGECPVLRPDFSTTFCNSGICAVTCNNGYQFSDNHNHCIPNLTKCGTNACQSIANGEVKCSANNTCIYSCNAAAGYTQTGPTTCTPSSK